MEFKPKIVPVNRCTQPVQAQELLGSLGAPRGARILVRGQLVDEFELEWFEVPLEGSSGNAQLLDVAIPVHGEPAAQVAVLKGDGPFKCPYPECNGREVRRPGPFRSHIMWHEQQQGQKVATKAGSKK